MKFFIAVLILAAGTYAQATCLDISGTYREMSAGSIPQCGGGLVSVKVWAKYAQTSCSEVSRSKVHKLSDGTFCESAPDLRVDDGKEHQITGSDYAFSYKISDDRHTVVARNVKSPAYSFNLFFTLDNQNNLVRTVKYSNGQEDSERLLRETPN